MPQNETFLRKTLAGLEGTRGTSATVTRKLYEQIRLMDAYEPLDFDENAGSYDTKRTFLHGPVNVTGTAEGPVSFEDFPWWLELGVKGGVTGTSDSGTPDPAYAYDFTPSTATDDLKSATMQHGVPDNVYRSVMVMVPEFTVKGDVDGDAAWMFSANLLARDLTNLGGGFTAGVTDRDREFVKAAGTQLYIDDAAEDIGTTLVSGKFISFSLTWNNAIAPKRFMEDETQISARIGRGPRQITGQVRLEFTDDTERAKYRSGATRAIRITRAGSVIHDAVTKAVTIDIPNAYWLTPSDDPRENNMTLTYGFVAYTSADVGYPATIEVVNALSALP